MAENDIRDTIRKILTFLETNIDGLTALYFDDKKRKQIRDYISDWRWYLSHEYFKSAKHRELQKPPFQWLYNILSEHRSITDLVTLLAAPGVKVSSDAQQGADILMLKLSRLYTYVEDKAVPKTFYLPPDHPDKTDQEGIPWRVSKSKGAKKWRKRKEQEKKQREEQSAPKTRYEKTPEELKQYLKAKNDRREFERKRREQIAAESQRQIDAAKLKERRKGWASSGK